MNEAIAIVMALTVAMLAGLAGGFYAGHEYAEWGYKARIAHVLEHAAERYTHGTKDNLQREAR